MKSILAVCITVLASGLALGTWRIVTHETHFGPPFAERPTANLKDVLAKPEAFLGKPLRLRGMLRQQCPKTGCWFNLADPSDPTFPVLRVAMSDPTSQLPQRLGKNAQVEGQLMKIGENYEFRGVSVSFGGAHNLTTDVLSAQVTAHRSKGSK
jgi:hypothetical protein